MAEKDYIVNLEDLKYVNGKIGDLKSANDDSNQYASISLSWNSTNGYIKYDDGGVSVSSAWKHTEFSALPEGAVGLYLTVPVVTNELQLEVVSAVSFYTSDEASTFITGGSEHVIFGAAQGYTQKYVSIPSTAKFIRVSALASYQSAYAIRAVINDYIVVQNYEQLLKTSANKVLVLCNDYQYGDNGPCWFKVTDGWTKDGITRLDGSVVFPLPDQGTLVNTNAPYDTVMSIIKSYVGNSALQYGNDYTLWSDTCTNEINCSTFVMSVLLGVHYAKSRYVLGTSASNVLGEHIGDNIIRYSNGIKRSVCYSMAQYYAMHKRLYKLPSNNIKAINMLKFGDLLFSHVDGVEDTAYYGLGHVAIVLGTIPSASAIIVAQAGGSGNVNNEATDVKTSCRILADSDFTSNYPVFARPDYGNGDMYTSLISAVTQTANGKYYLSSKTGLKLQLDTYLDSNGALAYSRTYAATLEYIEVPSSGSIIYNGSLTGLDANATPYLATLIRYDEDKKIISYNGILIENTPVSQQITKSGQTKPTKYIRIQFGHSVSQNVNMMLADLDRFSAEITVA